ncbi:MAG: response regulator, partial [Bacteroidales bacterium]|nr:response regulator [Bacteroidales bacterium]
AAEKPDLILLDLMMPVLDGFEVIRRLRADPKTADIRIVILSALNSNEDVVKGFNVGANDFIMKPIIMEKLLSCVVTQLQLVEAKKAAK